METTNFVFLFACMSLVIHNEGFKIQNRGTEFGEIKLYQLVSSPYKLNSLVKRVFSKARTEFGLRKIQKRLSRRRGQRKKRTPENEFLKIYTILKNKKREDQIKKIYLTRIISNYLKNRV